MRIDITNPLMIAYFSLLENKVFVGTKVVPVYSAHGVPDTAVRPYILLSPITSLGDNDKDDFAYVAAVQVDVVTAYPKGSGNTSKAATIANQIMGLVEPKPGMSNLSVAGHDVLTTEIETNTLSDQTDTENIVRQILTITHLITE